MAYIIFVLAILLSTNLYSKEVTLHVDDIHIINDVKILDDNGEKILVATPKGLFRIRANNDSWEEISKNLPIQQYKGRSDFNFRPIESIYTNDGKLIYVTYVGEYEPKRKLFVTNDGGAHWSEVYHPPVGLNNITLLPDDTLIIQTNSCLYRKSKDETSFTKLSCNSFEHLIFADTKRAFGFGKFINPDGNFMNSTDGGITWSNITTPISRTESVVSVDYSQNTIFLLASDKSSKNILQLLISKDEGKSWEKIESKNYLRTNHNWRLYHLDSGIERLIVSSKRLSLIYEIDIKSNKIIPVNNNSQVSKLITTYNISKNNPNSIWIGTEKGFAKTYPTTKLQRFFDMSWPENFYFDSDANTLFSSSKELFVTLGEDSYWKPLAINSPVNNLSMYHSKINDELYLLTGVTKGSKLLHSSNHGSSWAEIRKLRDNMGCSTNNIIITTNRLYCGSYYTSLYFDDDTHKIELDGSLASVAFKDQNEVMAFTYQGVYYSYNGGSEWGDIATFATNKVLPSGGSLIYNNGVHSTQAKILPFTENHFAAISLPHSTVKNWHPQLIHFRKFKDNIFYSWKYVELPWPDSSEIITNIGLVKFNISDDGRYTILIGDKIFSSIDAGMTWMSISTNTHKGHLYENILTDKDAIVGYHSNNGNSIYKIALN